MSRVWLLHCSLACVNLQPTSLQSDTAAGESGAVRKHVTAPLSPVGLLGSCPHSSFFFLLTLEKLWTSPKSPPPPPDKFARSHAIVESDALVQRVPRNRNNRPRGNQALWYLFNLVVFLNYHWLPLLSLTQFEFSVPVVAFDFRICLGAYFVCLSCSLNI